MSAANMQSYLNWYVYLFRVNKEADEWPETTKMVRHMLMADASIRSSTGSVNSLSHFRQPGSRPSRRS